MGQRHLTNLNPDIDLNRRKLRKRRTMIDLHQDLQSTFKMEVKLLKIRMGGSQKFITIS